MPASAIPKKGARVVVAMSGGVDSSVAAGWLKEQGYDVIGISLQLHDLAESQDNKFGTCCSLSDIQDARRVAETLDIPFYVTDMEEAFQTAVVDDFVHEYLNGRTPNPCVRCNEKVKFKRLMDWAMDLGADFLATGHYATIRYNAGTQTHELCKGADAQKDQSYFLFTLKQEDLARSLFPVGGFDKKQVREMARRMNLKVAEKPDSQEICFVQAKSYKDFIEEQVPSEQLRPGGAIVDYQGVELGHHTGLHQYTLGQRKGIGVNSLEPLYVLALENAQNRLVVGPERLLYRKRCTVSHVNWIGDPELDRLQAKIRYRSKESPIEATVLSDRRVEVHFTEPQRAITPGQALVFYREDRVVGGGWIDELPITP